MKKLRNLIALMAVFGMAAVFTGCGDDDDDDDNGGAPAGPQFAPGTQQALQAQSYTITAADGSRILIFPSAGTYSIQLPDGTTETGQISGLTRQGEEWIGTVTPANETGTVRSGQIRIRFTSRTANSFAGQITHQGPTGTETRAFTAVAAGTTNGGTDGTTNGGTDGTTNGGTDGTTNGGTDGTTNGGTDGTTNGGTDGLGTGDDLTGRTLQLTYEGGGGERFDFTSPSAGTYEQTNPFTYTYNSQTRELNVTLGHSGEHLRITLSPNSNQATVVATPVGGQPQTFGATYVVTP